MADRTLWCGAVVTRGPPPHVSLYVNAYDRFRFGVVKVLGPMFLGLASLLLQLARLLTCSVYVVILVFPLC